MLKLILAIIFKIRMLLFHLKTKGYFYSHEVHNFNYLRKSSFLKFRRDAFYDMLWQWEKNHKLENWNFAEHFSEKIKNLVSCKENMTNFLQFIKLFQEQLVLVKIVLNKIISNLSQILP